MASPDAWIDVRPLSPDQTRPLRQAVLRPELRVEELAYPKDGDLPTLHLGAFVGGALLGVASLYNEPRPGGADPAAWRLRGMAVAPEARGRGVGVALVRALVVHAEERRGSEIWCNARTSAQGFYEKLGFRAEGERFDLPGGGPHYLMARRVASR